MSAADSADNRQPASKRRTVRRPDASLLDPFELSGRAYEHPLSRAARAECRALDSAGDIAMDHGRADLARTLYSFAAEVRKDADEAARA